MRLLAWSASLALLATAVVWLAIGMELLGADRTGTGLRRVVIATPRVPPSASLLIAQRDGLFARHGLAVEFRLLPTGRDSLALCLADPDVLLAMTSETPLVHAFLEGAEPAIYATLASATNWLGVLSRPDSGISTPRDLGGRRIGVAHQTNAGYFLHCLLLDHEVAEGSVEVVELEPEEHGAALAEGRVAAVVAWSPLREQLLAQMPDLQQLRDGGIYMTTWNLIGAAQATAADRLAIEAVLRALVEVDPRLTASAVPIAAWTGMAEADAARLLTEIWFEPRLDQSLLLQMETQAEWLRPTVETSSMLRLFVPDPIEAVDRSRSTFIH